MHDALVWWNFPHFFKGLVDMWTLEVPTSQIQQYKTCK